MEELLTYINEQIEMYNSYLKAVTEEQMSLSKEAVLTPEEGELTDEQIVTNNEITEKLFYLMMNEHQLKGAIIAAENIKIKIELPQHAETIN